MNLRYLLFPVIATAAFAQAPTPRSPEPPLPREPLPPGAEVQRNYGPVGVTLLTPDVAPETIEKFRATYGAGSAPRIIVYVNRALIEPPAPPAPPVASNAGRSKSAPAPAPVATPPAPTIADQQTVREIEGLFGRIFRNVGGVLVDQTLALGMPGPRQTDENAARQRQALSGAADLAIEVLISTRTISVMAVSGDRSVTVPDIMATAIRLKDSAIVGQANATAALGLNVAASSNVRSATEATAIALLQDMLKNPAPPVKGG